MQCVRACGARREAGVYYVCELGREAGMCCVRAHTACDVDTTSATRQILAVSRRAAQTGLLTGKPGPTPIPTRCIHERQEQTPCMSGADKLHGIVVQTVKQQKARTTAARNQSKFFCVAEGRIVSSFDHNLFDHQPRDSPQALFAEREKVGFIEKTAWRHRRSG